MEHGLSQEIPAQQRPESPKYLTSDHTLLLTTLEFANAD